MPPRNPVVWLMTDERMGAALWPALLRLPPGSGVVFRHHATPPRERRALFARIRRIAVARRLILVAAGGQRLAGAGTHGAGPAGSRPTTWPAHARGEAVKGVLRGANHLFVSPIFPTRSHPGRAAIGAAGGLRIAIGLGVRIVALGGMDARRFRRIARHGFDGWAAIDALHPGDQKRKAVPR